MRKIKNKFDDFVESVENHRKKFLGETYPSMSREERIHYWLEETYKSMRAQGEALGDEYSSFSKSWYDASKVHEPDLDALFAEAVKGLGFEFAWAEYTNRISS